MLLPDAFFLLLFAVAHELLPLERILQLKSLPLSIHLSFACTFLLLLLDSLFMLFSLLSQFISHAIVSILDHLECHLGLLVLLEISSSAFLSRLTNLLLKFIDLIHFLGN